MIRASHLTKRFGEVRAVDDLTLEIMPGELFSLLGVNGAGKTTTIKMLSTLLTPSAGEVSVFGADTVRDAARVKELIAVSPQETAIAPNLTVYENLCMIAGICGMRKEKREEVIGTLAEKLGLLSVLKKRASRLSGGWQRRLSIAMALITDPKVLFLDEPTLGLDVLVRRELWSLISRLKGRMTILLTTHYMEEAEALSDRVGVMVKGRLAFVGTPRELCEKTGCEHFDDAFVSVVKEAGI